MFMGPSDQSGHRIIHTRCPRLIGGLHCVAIVLLLQLGKLTVSRVLCSSWFIRELPSHQKRQSSI